MRTPPDGITDRSVVAELATGWGIAADAIEYLPVGFGSHHWRADGADGDRWFVTADDLDTKVWSARESRAAAWDRLRASLGTARALHEGGLEFVVAPVPDRDGAVVRRVDDRFTMALYPHVAGQVHDWGGYSSLADRLAVLDRVMAVHDAREEVRDLAPIDDFALQERDELERALDDVTRPWDGGPYAERARTLLADRAAGVARELRRFDELVRGALARPERSVLTHGEPHVGNTIRTDAGWVLIDWDTTLVAPPERDLWMLTDDDGRVVETYAARTGRPVLAATLEQYRLGWDLTEIALAVARFRRAHAETDDTALVWIVLQRILTQLEPT